MTVANLPPVLPSDSSPLLPVIALVGRPNVGKSTLFNRLTRSRDALVADFPGLTRDRHYGQGKIGPRPYLVVDTGGFEPVAKDGIYHQMARQTLQAIDESDLVIFLTDARQGITPHDHEIANRLRKSGRPVILAVNKAEGMRHAGVTSEFYELGLGEPVPISSAHGEGVRSLLDYALEEVLPGPTAPASLEKDEFAADEFSTGKATEPELIDLPKNHRIKLAIVGRPNVGKSTLVNSLLGEERVIAFDLPGTTRDSIYIDFERNQKAYTLIDTAGLRKRGKVFEAIEKFSVVKTLQAIADANVIVLLLDASQDVSEQDAHIAGFVLESGRALVVGVNKWDGLDDYAKDRIKVDILRKMQFLNFAKFHFMSALKGFGVGALLRSVDEAHKAAFAKLSTPKLTRELQAAIEHQAPPRKGIFRPKMRYAHQGGQNPPIVIIHGNALDAISDSYKRYLEGRFREAFKLQGTPLRIEMRSTKNPYLDKDK